ncbi:MAG: hypothetical protein Ta2D_12070 [Rickettsiales bacterium]|nr:MAG: hypothetical protein Ta2D_12070 [Rickettsiales bacterium]
MKKYILFLIIIFVISNCTKTVYYSKEVVGDFGSVAKIYLFDKKETKFDIFNSNGSNISVELHYKNNVFRLTNYMEEGRCISAFRDRQPNVFLDKLEKEMEDKEACVDNPIKIDRIKQGYNLCLYDFGVRNHDYTEEDYANGYGNMDKEYALNKCKKYKNKIYKSLNGNANTELLLSTEIDIE